MKEENIRNIAYKKGMKHMDLFVKFILKRFPNELSPSYIGEWADRFLSGDPICYMDSKSKEIYKSLIE